MTAKIIDGKPIAAKIRAELKKKVSKLKEKGYVSKSEDFENFKKLLGYSSRSFSNKMKEAGLTFVNKKWIKTQMCL